MSAIPAPHASVSSALVEATPDGPADPNRLQAELDRLTAENESLRTELEQTRRMASIGALASSITHEFNNVLTTVINYSQMGLRREDHAVREKAFTRILAAGRRAAEITTGMLALARGDSPEMRPTDLSKLTRQVLVLVEKDLEKHRISLHVDWAGDGDDAAFASVHAAQMQQIVLNLVLNARQAMGPGGSLLVTTAVVDAGQTSDAGFAEIAVRDTGCGIEPDRLPHIFDPFHTTKTADADGCGGTGLGLATCREIIEAHGGTIRVESAVDRGTQFTIRLPRVPATAIVSA